MTREEIEHALLTAGTVNIHVRDGGPINLGGPKGKQLAKVVFDHLRSSSVNDLANNTVFFDALETAFCEEPDEIEADIETSEQTGEANAVSESRNWRLKKIETKGFGGLNAKVDDVFEFDAAGQDYCVEGQNGSGKSSLANAVLFALTGKVHRDQYGIWSDPGRCERVISDDGTTLGQWPPVATYPSNWESDHPHVKISVRLTFGNELDDEEIEAKRRLHGEPGSLDEEVWIDPRLTTVPTLIEAGLLMPMRIQHIRLPQANDNDQLVLLIRQLIGLEPLLDVANLVAKLAHGNQRFRKFARDNDAAGKARTISRTLSEAHEKIAELGTSLNLTVQIETNSPIPDERLKALNEANGELSRWQADAFQALSDLAFGEFDPSESVHRKRVEDTVSHLSLDSKRQVEPHNLPLVLKGIAELAKSVGAEDFEDLKSALRKASSDLADAIKWADRQRKDTLLRLKAVAASHFEDCDDPLCPLCGQSIKDGRHFSLVEDLRALKTDAQAAQTRLADACRRIEQKVERSAESLVPATFMQVERFSVKQNIQDQVRKAFVEASHVSGALPGFAEIARRAVDSVFKEVEEFEFGSKLPEPVEGDHVARVRRFIDHLGDLVQAAKNWQLTRQTYREAWSLLFSKDEKQSLTAQILQLEDKIRGVEPFRSASEKIEQALEIAPDYNKIVKRQAQREKIVEELKPLLKLRDLVNRTTRRTIDDVSEIAKDVHTKIYTPEELAYEKARITEFRGKQSLSFLAKLGKGGNWQIDASLLANVSWMRGILWAFVFAIRERAISQAGHCPFDLMILDDPQITFDSRNLKGWVRFLGSSEGLKQHQPCQLLVTTHSRPFALEMMAMPNIRMAEIETGQPWSKPAQVVEGDFAGVRFAKMTAENSDDRARSLIGDIRVLAETLLKHAIEPFEPAFVNQSETTLGRIIEMIKSRNTERQTPYTDSVFGDLIAVKSSHRDLYRQLSEPHHTVSETITVREAQSIYEFWQQTLFPAIRNVWEKYRFLQKVVVGEAAAILLPTNCDHEPVRSNDLAVIQPNIVGRVSAYSDGHAASAIRIDHLVDGEAIDLSARAAYRLEKDTLSPVARVGDILLTRLDRKCRTPNLIVEDRGTHRVARRWLEYEAAPTLAVLAASTSNPKEVPPAIISRAEGANRRKIVGVLFAADRLRLGDRLDPEIEATHLDADNEVVANLIADTDVFEVQGSSAEPLALDKQYLLAKPATDDSAAALRQLDSRPVIAEDSEDCAFFKRLRVVDPRSVVLESLDNSGLEGPIILSVDSRGSGPQLTRVREVVGVIFDKG